MPPVVKVASSSDLEPARTAGSESVRKVSLGWRAEQGRHSPSDTKAMSCAERVAAPGLALVRCRGQRETPHSPLWEPPWQGRPRRFQEQRGGRFPQLP